MMVCVQVLLGQTEKALNGGGKAQSIVISSLCLGGLRQIHQQVFQLLLIFVLLGGLLLLFRVAIDLWRWRYFDILYFLDDDFQAGRGLYMQWKHINVLVLNIRCLFWSRGGYFARTAGAIFVIRNFLALLVLVWKAWQLAVLVEHFLDFILNFIR